MALAVYAYVFAVGQVSNNAKQLQSVALHAKPSFQRLLHLGSCLRQAYAFRCNWQLTGTNTKPLAAVMWLK